MSDAFRIIENCSYQLAFVLSFQVIGVLAKFNPFESVKNSELVTDVNFRNPAAEIFLFGL
jgi:hypothetical protein